MKQMTLFDSFKKKGSQVAQTQSKLEQSVRKDPPEKCHGVGNENDNQNKAIHIATSAKKKNRLTLDSDDQNEYPTARIHSFEAQQEMGQQRDHQKKLRKPPKQKPASELSGQQSQEQQCEKEKKTVVSRQKNKNEVNADEENPLSQFTDATPQWAQKQYCRDSQKRSPDHPDYDPTTLYVPETQWGKFTSPMKQFWKIKSENFDKIILFKLGKFYEMFYDDAAVGNKYLDLKFMGTKMHTGFPEKSLERYGNELVRLGFKTVIVQQMETPEQMNERVKMDKLKGKKSEKTLSRQVTQILTKGTLPPNDENEETYLPNYLLSLRVHLDHYAFALLQIGTNEIALGIAQGLENFKTILYQTRPVEVVYDPDNVSGEVCRMMEKTFLQIQMSKVANKKNLWHPLTALCQIERLLKQGNIKKPKTFEMMDAMEEANKNLLYSTLSGMFDYLKKVFRFDYVIGTARFVFYHKSKQSNTMILDSQALQHLQIFETFDGQSGSLFKVIDRTKTKFGKRLMRRWIMSPLTNIQQLNERLDAIEDLQENVLEREKMAQTLRKLPDLEKKANKLYHYAIKNTNASKAIYFQDIHVNRLKQFKDFMEKLESAWESVMKVGKISHQFRSSRLKNITNLNRSEGSQLNQDDNYYDQEEEPINGNLPNVLANLEEFKGYVKWEGNVPVPQRGLVAYYDQLQDEIQTIKQELENYLDTLRYQMNEPNLKFVHTKSRYQIEMPEKSEKRRPKDFQFSSKKSGYSRYLSPSSKKLVKQLEKTEDNLKEQLGLFVSFFFQQFKKKHQIWHRFIENLAEIDCLISLSEYSFQNSKVRPEFTQSEKFQIIEARHPSLTTIDFIPNDIVLDKKVMLLTGPNMGGKSTILRTACTLAVLAQTGCYVPASKYCCCPLDRIFTRIGASDKLELGKSTFFIEMEQTKSILTHGTERSLAIVDELGRGTSTFDGLAIAHSVLKDITQRIKCFCLFATHYHMLLEQFRNDPGVELMKMDYLVKQVASQQQMQVQRGQTEEQIVFLYKLTPGNVDKSFGLSIASMVGISADTIQRAAVQAHLMNRYIEEKQKALLQRALDFAHGQNEDEFAAAD